MQPPVKPAVARLAEFARPFAVLYVAATPGDAGPPVEKIVDVVLVRYHASTHWVPLYPEITYFLAG